MGKASPNAIRAGQAFVEIFADDSRMVTGLRAASGRLKAWGASLYSTGKSLFIFGSLLTTPLVASVKIMGTMADEMQNLHAKTGMTVEFLSTLVYAANQVNLKLDPLERGIRMLNISMIRLGSGDQNMVKYFGMLGISFKDLQALSPEERFLLVASAINRVQDAAVKANMAVKLMGRSGTAMLPLIAGGAAAIKAAQAHGRDIGIEMSTEAVARARDYAKLMRDIWSQIKMLAFEVGSALVPALKDLSETGTRNLAWAIKWVRVNGGLISSYAKLSVAILGTGIALIALGKALSLMASAVTILRGVVAVCHAGLVALAAVAAFCVTPVGVLTIALAGLAAAVAWRAGGIRKATSVIGKGFIDMKRDVSDAVQGMKDAFASGDVGLAVEIMWTTIQLEFQRGVLACKELWFSLRKFIFDNPLAKKINKAFMGAELYGKDIVVAFNVQMIEWAGAYSKTQAAEQGKLTPEESKRIDAAVAQQQKRWTDAGDVFEADLLNAADTLQAVGAMLDQQALSAIQKRIDALKARLTAQVAFADELATLSLVNELLGTGDKEEPPPPPKPMPPIDVAEQIKGAVMGTFNAASLSLMGYATGTQERIAKATEETAEATEEAAETAEEIVAAVGGLRDALTFASV